MPVDKKNTVKWLRPHQNQVTQRLFSSRLSLSVDALQSPSSDDLVREDVEFQSNSGIKNAQLTLTSVCWFLCVSASSLSTEGRTHLTSRPTFKGWSQARNRRAHRELFKHGADNRKCSSAAFNVNGKFKIPMSEIVRRFPVILVGKFWANLLTT